MWKGLRSMLWKHATQAGHPGGDGARMFVNAPDGVGEEHDPELARGDVEGSAGELVGLRVGNDEHHVAGAGLVGAGRARRTNASEMSTPITLPAGPTARANSIVPPPPPEPISTTRSPGCNASASSNIGVTGAVNGSRSSHVASHASSFQRRRSAAFAASDDDGDVAMCLTIRNLAGSLRSLT